jgi:two-component sensor histidine kinase
MCTEVHRQFSAATATARQARQFALATLTNAVPHADTNVIDDCELVIGELAANAINAQANLVDVTIHLHHNRVELAVTDDAHGWPTPQPPDPAAASGRGLQIVDALSAQWGVTIGADRRTTVWAHVSCNPLQTTNLRCRFR